MCINNGVASAVELQHETLILLWRFCQLFAVVVGICSSQSSDVLCLPCSPDVDGLVLLQSHIYDLHQLNYCGKLVIVCLCFIIVWLTGFIIHLFNLHGLCNVYEAFVLHRMVWLDRVVFLRDFCQQGVSFISFFVGENTATSVRKLAQ